MEYKIERKNVTSLAIRLDPGEPLSGRCKWAEFIMGLDTLSLIIRSDAGSLDYVWQNIGDDSPTGFLFFLAKLDKDYFLRKLSGQKEFDLEQSIAAICNCINESEELTDTQKEVLICETKEIDACCESEFYRTFCSLKNANDELYQVVTDYPAAHCIIADIFTQYAQPALREYCNLDKFEQTEIPLAKRVREVYVPLENEVVDGIPTAFIEYTEFWNAHKTDDGFSMVYLDENNKIVI